MVNYILVAIALTFSFTSYAETKTRKISSKRLDSSLINASSNHHPFVAYYHKKYDSFETCWDKTGEAESVVFSNSPNILIEGTLSCIDGNARLAIFYEPTTDTDIGEVRDFLDSIVGFEVLDTPFNYMKSTSIIYHLRIQTEVSSIEGTTLIGGPALVIELGVNLGSLQDLDGSVSDAYGSNKLTNFLNLVEKRATSSRGLIVEGKDIRLEFESKLKKSNRITGKVDIFAVIENRRPIRISWGLNVKECGEKFCL